jgi:threonine dehydratase
MAQPRPTLADIETAAQRLAGHAVRTPLLEAPLLNDELGGRLLVKPECLQLTGSFKFRGAFNKISSLDEAARGAGVIAYSSGNHAQGVAAAARMFNVPAVIVMPADAPAIKIANTRAWGAEVVTYDRHGENREALAQAIAQERGLTLVPPYDDPAIIAGQGTVGLEIAQDCQARGLTPDAVVICCGGGGLSSGSAIALSAHFPDAALHTAEPAGWDDTARSLAAGERVANEGITPSLCDALMAPIPGEITFPINRDLMTSGAAVDDKEVIAAMLAANRSFKLVAEPGGAAALAVALAGKVPVAGRTVIAVISGGNVDPAAYARLIGGAA